MAQESVEHMAGMTEARTPTTARAVQDVAERAGSYVQHQAAQLAGRAQDLAQDLAHEANERMKDYTGRPVEDWVGDVRDFVRKHPLQVLAATIGLGYVLGKVMRR